MSEGKTVRIDRTNAVIVDQENKIIENGIHLRCPHCGKALLHNRETVNIWTVGAIEQRVCCKCRKNFKTLSLAVPRGMKPETLYNRIPVYNNERTREANSAALVPQLFKNRINSQMETLVVFVVNVNQRNEKRFLS